MLSGYRSLLFVLILSVNTIGQIFTEDFNYELGKTFPTGRWSLIGISPWIVEGDLTYINYPSVINNKKLMMSDNPQSLSSLTAAISPAITTNSIYCSFLVNLFSISDLVSSNPINNLNCFFVYGGSGSTTRVYTAIIKSGENTFRIGIANKDSNIPDYLPIDLPINTTHLIVIGYTFNTGAQTAKLWINPSLSGEEPIPNKTISLNVMTSVEKVIFHQRQFTGDLYIDAIRVAETWNDSALPVELEAFNAEVVNNSVVLNWRTATEVNNYGFEVERSYDKSNWECIKFVPGNGNSNRVIHYTYTDNQAAGSTVYYRLKQVDTDGTYTYSEITEIKISEMSYALYQNYPNPFNPETTIKYSITQRGFVNIKIYDMTGKEVKQLVNESMDSGEYFVKFNGSDLPSGVYMYRIRVNGFVESRKMLLLK